MCVCAQCAVQPWCVCVGVLFNLGGGLFLLITGTFSTGVLVKIMYVQHVFAQISETFKQTRCLLMLLNGISPYRKAFSLL